MANAQATVSPTIPSLANFCRHELNAILASVDGQRMLDDATAIVATDRWNSFHKFAKTATTISERYEAAGVTVETHSVPTRPPDGSGRWQVHHAVDVHEATAAVISPKLKPFLEYRANPWQLVQWSAATPEGGVVGDLVAIDDRNELADLPNGDLKNHILLTNLECRSVLAEVHRLQASAVICDSEVHGHPHAVAWQKVGWGGPPMGSESLVGLAASHFQGQWLRKNLARHGSLKLQIKIKLRRYDGSHEVLSGVVRGADNLEQEIWCLAHSSEPGAADNASGVVVCLEAARVLETLIREGQLPRPKRSIRFINAYECYGFFHYLEHGRRFEPPLAGVCIDTVGIQRGICSGELWWHDTVPASAQFVNEVGQAIFRILLLQKNTVYRYRRGPFYATSDTLLSDPKYGFPCPWLTTAWLEEGHLYHEYHSSADTIDILDRDGLAVCAAGIAGYGYFLAHVGSPELLELAQAETQRLVAVLQNSVGPFVCPDALLAQHQATIRQLKRWIWGTGSHPVHATLEECKKQLKSAALEQKKQSTTAASPAHRLIPYRTAPLTPDHLNIPQSIHAELRQLHLQDWALFWADGERNIDDIAQCLRWEYGRDVATEDVHRFFVMMAELNYVQLLSPDQRITRARLDQDLAKLGLRPGMDVMVHSSLSSIGHVEGGAETVVDALLSAIGPDGTLLMPSFNFRHVKVFNPATTPAATGAITDVFWRRPEAVRSLHATHSVAAIGPKAWDWCAEHHQRGIWAPNSPIGRLVHGGGMILLIGVDHNATTAYHVAEVSLDAPCLDCTGHKDRIVDASGQVMTINGLRFRSETCPFSLEDLDNMLEQDGLQQRGRLGQAECRFLGAYDLWKTRRAQLSDSCASCSIRPQE